MKSKPLALFGFGVLLFLVIMVWVKACSDHGINKPPSGNSRQKKIVKQPSGAEEVDFPGIGPVKGKILEGILEVKEEEDQQGLSMTADPAQLIVDESGNFLYLRNHAPNQEYKSTRRLDLGLKFLKKHIEENSSRLAASELRGGPASFTILGTGNANISDPKVRRKLLGLIHGISNVVELWGVKIYSPQHGEIDAIIARKESNEFVDPQTRDRLVWQNGVSRFWTIDPISDDISMYPLAQVHVVEEWETPPANALPGPEYGRVFEGEVLFEDEYKARVQEVQGTKQR